jgi:hypothetical protein
LSVLEEARLIIFHDLSLLNIFTAFLFFVNQVDSGQHGKRMNENDRQLKNK